MFEKIVGTSAQPSREEQSLEEFCRNDLFDVLKNQRRRYTLLYLHQQNKTISCSDIATQIAAWETGSEPEQVDRSRYQSVYNSLYQTHLPCLEQAGLVEYDSAANSVTPTARMAEIESFINSDGSTLKERLFGYLK
jgi:hypothetical protein